MLLVTGHAEKLEGLAFVADTDNVEQALDLLIQKWNETHDASTQLKRYTHRKGNAYYEFALQATVDTASFGCWLDETGEITPCREGWLLCVMESFDGFFRDCPW